MSKSITKGAHWLPRASQYSLHGQRNGRVDVLPPNAKMQTFGDLRERYTRYRAEFRQAQLDYEAAKKSLDDDLAWQRHKKFFEANKHRQYVAMPSSFAKRLDHIEELRKRQCSLAAKCQDFKVIFNEVQNATYERIWIQTAREMLPWDVVSQIEGVVSENLRSADSASEGK